MSKPSDQEIIDTLRGHGGRMTYVVGNVLRRTHRGLKTDFVRRRLFALEKVGVVKHIPSSYVRELCWDTATKEPS